jgi:hypothetical protein
MKRRFYSLPLVPVLAAFFFVACGHTNNLARYDVVGKTAIYRSYAGEGAASSIVVIESPSESSTIADVAAAVGSVIAGAEGRRKLQDAIDVEAIAASVARGIQQSTEDYLRMRAVGSMAEDPDFIIETNVERYEIVSTTLGMCARVSGESRMIDRKTGGIVWENSESHTIPLSETWVALAGPQAVRSGVGIFNAVTLLGLSAEELRKVINEGAAGAGREIGEELRDDVADMRH